MGMTNKPNDCVEEVDVIIAGGGTSACVLAGRLAEADPGLSILVVEGGLDKDLLRAWEKDFKDKPDKPMMLMGLITGFVGDQSALDPGQYVLMANYTAYPYSRGSVHITGPNVDDALDLSIPPENVGANTNNTALVIGEKAADIIAQELSEFTL